MQAQGLYVGNHTSSLYTLHSYIIKANTTPFELIRIFEYAII